MALEVIRSALQSRLINDRWRQSLAKTSLPLGVCSITPFCYVRPWSSSATTSKEYVNNPRGLCSEAHELLRPNDAIFLIGHDYGSWAIRFLGESRPFVTANPPTFLPG
jgi:hypothetical protein